MTLKDVKRQMAADDLARAGELQKLENLKIENSKSQNSKSQKSQKFKNRLKIPATSCQPDSDSEDEDDFQVWEPQGSVNETLETLSLFIDFEGDGRKLKKAEIRESYKNFDAWLESEISKMTDTHNAEQIELF
jgi:hypothetical protein